jgi:hypothetical protein
VHIFMQQDALSAVNFVECKIFCVWWPMMSSKFGN